MEQIMVPFRADDHGRGEPSWGQRELWGVGTQLSRHVTLGGVTALPRGTSVEVVAGSLGGLISRHPTLRTRFHVGAGPRLSEQVLADAGEISVAVVDADEPEQAALDTVIAYDQDKFDYEQEWPLRVAVIRHRGAATHMAAVYNHIALDARGLDAMLSDMVNRGCAPDGAATLQPLEQAAWQLSAAGRRQSGRALRHWSRVLHEAPARHFGQQCADDSAPYLKLVLESEVARLAVQAISERTRQSSGHILLAAFAVAVAHLAGSSIVAIRVVVDNRFRPGLSDSVSTVSQMGLWSIDASAPFDTVLARALTASLDTYMNAYYDPEDRQSLIDSIDRERRQQTVLDVCYNDRRRSAQDLKPATASTEEGAAGVAPTRVNGHTSSALAKAATRTALRDARQRSVLRWDPWTAPTKPFGETLYLHIDDAPAGPELVFTVCGDATYLAPDQIEECAHLIEDVLVQAALDLGASVSTAG